jgi:DNA-binding NtrC family response regulator
MKTILVVDDAPMIREQVKGLLEAEGYEVIEAGDGEEAVELARRRRPALSVIDIFLPKKGGLEVMGEIMKTDKRHKIIAISGGESFHAQTVVQLAAIFDVAESFTKPLDAKKLKEAVRRLTGGPQDDVGN